MSATYQDVLNELANVDYTTLSQLSDSERLAKLTIWMERRKPFITLAQCDRYDYYYETFLVKTTNSLFADCLNWILAKKTFSAAEINQRIELCSETIKDLNKHTKFFSAEIKHIKKWFYAEMQFKSKNPVLEESRKLLINLYEYLENANEHKLTLFYLKDFYTTVKLTNPLLEHLQEMELLRTEIDALLTQYKTGANLIGDHINEGKIAQWLNRIECEIRNCKKSKTDTKIFIEELEKIYEKCQSMNKNFKQAVTIWENNTVEDNLRNMNTQLENLTSKMDENLTVDISYHYYKFCIDELNFAFNKMQKAPELVEGVDDLIVELKNMLKQAKAKLKREVPQESNREAPEESNEDFCEDLGDRLSH